MTGRAFLNVVYSALTERMTAEDLHELLHPPTREERRSRRRDELASLGIEVG